MGKIILTSVTQNVMEHILKYCNNSPGKTKVAFIPTAADPYENKWFIEEDLKKWRELKFDVQIVDIKNKNYHQLYNELKKFDIIYVAGGNTFYLLQIAIQSEFDKVIKKLIEEGKTYVGGSAGALLVCPTIKPIKEFDDSTKAPDLKSYEGLNLVDFVVLPHFNEKNKKKYEDIIKKYDKLIFVTLNDTQLIIVDKKGYEVKG